MLKCKQLAHSRSGFTLVELIVVMVILSLLLSITVPSMTQWIAKSKLEKAKTECRACVVAAQTLAVEKYSSNRPEDSVSAWIANTDTRSKDITSLAAVSGTVAADHAKGSGDGGGVTFEAARGYTVTYLKYYYTDAQDVYVEYVYPGDITAGADSGSGIPTPGAATPTPKPTATASPVPTVTPQATPVSGDYYIATTPSTVTTIKLTPYAQAWPATQDNFQVKTGTCFEHNGSYYYVIQGRSYGTSQTPEGEAGTGNLAKFTGTLYNGPVNPAIYDQKDGGNVYNGDLYYLNGVYYVFTGGTQSKSAIQPPTQNGGWEPILQ